MFIPIGHDRQVVQRLPVITLSLLVINTLCFALMLTVGRTQHQQFQKSLGDMLSYAAQHPGVLPTEAVEKRLAELPLPESELERARRDLLGRRSAGAGTNNSNPGVLLEQVEMAGLCGVFVKAYDETWAFSYGFIPREHKRSPPNYLSAMFLHFSLSQFVVSMFFLWLAGMALEDLLGRAVFAALFLLGGAAATLIHATVDPQSGVPAAGISGATAGLMGALMARHATAQVKYFYVLPTRLGTTEFPAYAVMPFWCLGQFLFAMLTRMTGLRAGFSVWAEIGCFAFGAGLALLLAKVGLEQYYIASGSKNKAGAVTNRIIVSALEKLEKGEANAAMQKLQQYLFDRPEDVDALAALTRVYQQMGQRELRDATYHRLIRAHLKTNDRKSALAAYGEMLDNYAQGELPYPLPAREWTTLCDYLKELDRLEEAAGEYEKLGHAHPTHELAVRALIHAAELHLHIRNDCARALDLFQQASALKPTNPMWQKRVIDGLARIEKAAQVTTGRRR
ncbi:MAG TPA: rhomboid family intramembrane serine protease [Blastocatellia bacterium]|nr:rhomboid family intramembrane serine protease [Blastocatellia bacterium]